MLEGKTLQDKIEKAKAKKGLLLMPHLVLGFPSFEENEKVIAAMVGAGADIIEMQIPFSEPMADGPVLLRANGEALKRGATTTKCLGFAEKITALYPDVIFLFMTYYNVPFAYGVPRFVEKAKACGVEGLIIPDLPPEEADEVIACCDKAGIAPIFFFTPTTTDARLKTQAGYAKGMIYCVGRRGVTGVKTEMGRDMDDLIARYRDATDLPLALGFGIQTKADVDFLRGKVDIAIIGTKLFQIHEEQGAEAVGAFLKGLRD